MHRIKLLIRTAVLLALSASILVAPVFAQTTARGNIARVGVLAFRGAMQANIRWQPLIDYLNTSVPEWQFELVPVTLVSAPEKISQQKIDFLITNPGHYVELAQDYGLGALATRERLADGQGVLEYGVAIFSARTNGFGSLDDLKGKRLAAVSPDAFGGFQLAWHEFRQVNIDLYSDFQAIKFMGFPQDAIVAAVKSGDVDAGVVRSGLLENLAQEGRIDLADFVAFQNNSQPEYPYQVSGALYPEWPFTALPGINKSLRENVTLALLATQGAGIQSRYSLRDLWSAPLAYEDVRQLVLAYQTRNNDTAAQTDGRYFYVAMLIVVATGAAILLRMVKNGMVQTEPAVPAAVPLENSAVSAQEKARFQSLTKRECEVLVMICKGELSKTIAQNLGISPKTVEYHRANLLQKTKAGTTAHLVQLATRIEGEWRPS